MSFCMTGTFSGGNFHAQVAARHHHAVGDVQDGVQVVDGLRLLQLGNDRWRAPCAADQRLQLGTSSAVRTKESATSRRRARARMQVVRVLLRERRHAQAAPGRLMPLCSLSRPPSITSAFHVLAWTATDAQLEQRRRRAECVAGLELPGGKGRKDRSSDGEAVPSTSRGVMVTREPRPEHGLAAVQASGANLRALQVRPEWRRCARRVAAEAAGYAQ